MAAAACIGSTSQSAAASLSGETSVQLVGETRIPLPVAPGQPACYDYDYEYERHGGGRWLLLIVPASTLAVLELLHPPGWDDTVYKGVAPVVDWWITLHLLMLVLFALVVLTLFLSIANQRGPAPAAALVALGLFVVGNSAFIAIDGIGSGLFIKGAQDLATAEQAGVEQALQNLWNSPMNEFLARWQWLAWLIGIGASALALYPQARGRVSLALLGVGLVVVLGGGLGLDLDLGVPVWSLGVVAAIAAAAMLARQGGAFAIPFGLLLLAAVLPQHGSPPGAIGVACLGLALIWRELSVERSGGPAGVLAPPAAATAS
jgi:hypothetical protein